MLAAFLGNFGNGSTSTKYERELRAVTSNMKANVEKPYDEKHWWQQVYSNALARGVNKSVFVITTGQAVALKFTIFGDAPRSLSVFVTDMGPDGGCRRCASE